MTLTSKPLAFLVFVIMFGGIGISSAFGWWETESTKEPAKFTEGEFAGQANPADIRGSYTFGDIADSFDVTPEMLAQAFQVATDDPASFAVKELESLYLDSGYEVGTNSVRLFVAYYLGLPFDTTGQEIYLPQPATDILLNQATLTPEQLTYVQTFTVEVKPASSADLEPDPVQSAESASDAESTSSAPDASSSSNEDYLVKGKTIFGDLIRWGVPQQTIEQIIGAPMPDPAMKVKDFATANGLSFETLKTQLQTEVDKVKP
ncbi:MAG: hypothetical protein C3F07_06845 [Anaerolineales bacterium]|nr:hypothetical protein [Anaerolineae bacterium]PWB74875.1 MAG: hypothetical protein C3F07_06845 [Anaerolineales bacterium]